MNPLSLSFIFLQLHLFLFFHVYWSKCLGLWVFLWGLFYYFPEEQDVACSIFVVIILYKFFNSDFGSLFDQELFQIFKKNCDGGVLCFSFLVLLLPFSYNAL